MDDTALLKEDGKTAEMPLYVKFAGSLCTIQGLDELSQRKAFQIATQFHSTSLSFRASILFEFRTISRYPHFVTYLEV